MTDSETYAWFCFAVALIGCFLINGFWYRQITKMNREWYEHCKSIIEEVYRN